MILGHINCIYRIVFLIATTARYISFFYIISTGRKKSKRCTTSILRVTFTGGVQLDVTDIVRSACIKIGLTLRYIILDTGK